MCGIAGLIAKKKIETERIEAFIVSSDLMTHRGPDYKGVYREDDVVLIHHRLSIIDLDERSNQPYYSDDKSFVTVYNGELYNYQEISKEFQIERNTSSDTEVLLKSFVQDKYQAIKKWNGIFATAILDIKSKALYFARDRFGVKPLYFYEDDDVLVFASEAKVILNWLPKFNIDFDVLGQFTWFGNTTGLKTIAKGLEKFKPGNLYKFDLEKKCFVEREEYWSLSSISEIQISEHDAIIRTRELLEKGIKRQLVADVPIGILLSGGIDSSSIVAYASRHYTEKIDTYSVEYDYNIGGKSELAKAAMIAKKFDTNHHELRVETKDVVKIFTDLVYQYDEPFADPASIPLFQLANACKSNKRVILQGDGGDELFAGYRRYNVMNDFYFWKYISKLYPLIANNRWRERMKRINFVLSQKSKAKLLALYLTEEIPYKSPYQIYSSRVAKRLDNDNWIADYSIAVNEFSDKDRVQELLYTDAKILLPNRFLEKVDKATMLSSIEARVPFLDNELAEFALSLPSKMKVRKGKKKYILKKALEGTIPNEILYGPKRGFDVPFREWLRKDLYVFARETFESHDLGILNKEQLLKVLDLHKTGKVDYSTLLWKSLVLAKWLGIYSSKISI